MATVGGYVNKYFVKKDNTFLWYFVLDLGKDANGKRIQNRKRGFISEAAAKKALREVQVAADKGTYVKPSKQTFNEYITEWFKGKKNTIGSHTASVYESNIRIHIIPALGNVNLSTLSTIIIKKFINDLVEKKLAAGTIKKIFNIINSSLNDAIEEGLLSRNTAASVKNKPKIVRKEVVVWNADEVKNFLTYVDELKSRYYIVFHLALATGMRQGELLGLRWSDINFEGSKLSIGQTLSHNGLQFNAGAKTASGNRSIALDSKTLIKIQEHQEFIRKEKFANAADYKDHNLVICTGNGLPCKPRFLDKYWNNFRDKAGMRKIKFHDLRHTHASLLLKNNEHPKVVSERLGHSSIQMTIDLYSHLFPNMQSDAAENLGKTIF